jgi:hypothetical protein
MQGSQYRLHHEALCIFDKLQAVSFGEKCSLHLRGEKRIISSVNEIMQDQRHMWRTARKSDYGTSAASVVLLCKKGESNYGKQ